MRNIILKSLLLRYALVFTLWLGFKPVLATTSFSMLPIDQLTKHADLVVHGQVETISSFMENDQIFTNIQVSVKELFKGKASKNMVTLRMYGGTADGMRTRVIGAPCLSNGEEVVLFLKSDGRGSYGVLNLAEGKFGVLMDRDGSKRVVRDLSGIRYLYKAKRAVPTSLKELKEAVSKSR